VAFESRFRISHDLERAVRTVVLLRSIRGILRVVHVAEQQIREVQQSRARTSESPCTLRRVDLAKEAKLSPALLDGILSHRGMRCLDGVVSLALAQQVNRAGDSEQGTKEVEHTYST